MTTVEVLPSEREVAERAADLVAELLAGRPDACVVVPAGRTPVPLYAELVRRVHGGALDLSRARLFQLDECVGVAADDARSFHSFLRRQLLDPAGVDPERAYLLDGRARDPDAEIARHAAALQAAGGADLALLGLGVNGHVAFNEPGSTADDGARRVRLADATREHLRRTFAPDEPPLEGLTLGLCELRAARRLVLLVVGASKAAPLRRLVQGGRTPDGPVSLLADHPSLHVLADADAMPDRRAG